MSLKKSVAALFALALSVTFIVPVMAQNPSATQAAKPAPAVTATTQFYVEAFLTVNVRSGPSAKYTKIGQLTKGDTADITGRDSASNNWVRIDFNGDEGWVSFSFVTVRGNIDDAPIEPPGPNAVLRPTNSELANAASKNFTVVTRVNASVRSTTDIKSDVVIVVPFGTKLTPDARTASKNRLHVTYQGKSGWVSTGLVNITGGNIDTLPIQQ